MAFDLVRFKHLRNLKEGELSPDNGVNFIVGPNGSGKTSVLEAVYILSRGRSFRDSRISRVITIGTESVQLYGSSTKGMKKVRIGISVSQKGTEVRLNGSRLGKLSDLAKEIPTLLITPRSHEILERGASNRRRLIEWGVFHVEPTYQYYSSRYQRALTQRNLDLKKDPKLAQIWLSELIDNGEKLDAMRERYVEGFNEILTRYLETLAEARDIAISWKRGWSQEQTLEQAFCSGLKSDIRRGFTQRGPHRADLVITMNGQPVDRWASRGQQKLVIISMFLTQARQIRESTEKKPILLLDDIAAELDDTNRKKVFSVIKQEGFQALITTADKHTANQTGYDKLFHVEHGGIE